MKMRPATLRQMIALEHAIHALELARASAALADSPKLLGRIRSALKSAGGADRHMQHRLRRAGFTWEQTRRPAIRRAQH